MNEGKILHCGSSQSYFLKSGQREDECGCHLIPVKKKNKNKKTPQKNKTKEKPR